MNKRILIASIVGAAIAFLWGYVSWSLLDWHKPQNFTNSDEVAQSVVKNTNGHGMYVIPVAKDDGQPDAEAIRRGPFIYATVRPGTNEDWNTTKPMVLNYSVNLFLALILAVIMAKRSHYISKLTTGILFGLFAGITASLPMAIWMELPQKEMIARLCDPVISWALAAAAMGLIVKKPRRRIFSS